MSIRSRVFLAFFVVGVVFLAFSFTGRQAWNQNDPPDPASDGLPEMTADPTTDSDVRPLSASPLPAASSHTCGPGCGSHHQKGAIPTASTSQPVTATWAAPEAREGEQTRVDLPDGSSVSGTVVMRHQEPDGREVMGMKLADGSTLHAVFRGDEWTARLTHPTRRQAWLWEGGPEGTTAQSLDITEIMCAWGNGDTYTAGLPPVVDPPLQSSAAAPLEVADAQPIYESLPGANGVIYLDFDGELVENKNWNSSYTSGAPIDAQAAPYTEADIAWIFQSIAEDYRPFNVNVTTNRAVFDAAPVNRRVMVIFTPTSDWYGAAGGVAYVNVFGSSFYDEPCWVFTNNLSDYKDAAEAGAHEAGHTLGLRHDGSTLSTLNGAPEYYSGHGTTDYWDSDPVSWAPIMGASYYKVVTQWSKGEYTGATNTEDDLAIIAGSYNGLGYRTDDHAGSPSGATPVALSAGENFSASGRIERTTDVDVFLVQADAGTMTVNVTNDTADTGPNPDPNLDIGLRVLDAAGNPLAGGTYDNTIKNLDASLSLTVAGGTYYIEVQGVGWGTADTGYTDYASLGAYTISGTAPQPSNLFAEITSPAAPELSLPLGTGIILEGNATGGALAWQVAGAPTGGSALFSDSTQLSTRCTFDTPGTYQIRLFVDGGSESAEDLLTVSVEAPGDPPQYAVRAPRVDLGPDRIIYNTKTQLTPVVEDDGAPSPLTYAWTILSGNGSLSDTGIEQPTLEFGVAGPVALRLVVSDGAANVFDEGRLTADFEAATLMDATSTGWVFVPTDASVDAVWKNLGFDHASWRSGTLGVGYDDTPGNEARRIFNPLIGPNLDIQAEMYKRSSSCYLRVPFTVPSGEGVLRLDLRLRYDDGFVAYINGAEVARGDVPAGNLAWDSTALADRDDEAALSSVTFPIELQPGLLVDGTNILAIHGVNEVVTTRNNKGDPRFILLPEMDAIITNPPAPPPSSPYDQTVSVVDDPDQQGPEDNPDGDLWNNLFEHALGGNPMTRDSVPFLKMNGDTGLSLLLPTTPPADVRYDVLRCPTLSGTWAVAASRTGDGPWTGLLPVGTQPAPDNREWINFPAESAPRIFYKLRVTLTGP